MVTAISYNVWGFIGVKVASNSKKERNCRRHPTSTSGLHMDRHTCAHSCTYICTYTHEHACTHIHTLKKIEMGTGGHVTGVM